jgi:hypothetical protein
VGYIFLAILIGVIIWTLWRLGTKRRLPLNHYQPFDDAMEGTKDDMKSSSEYEETTSKKENQ